MPPKNYTQAVKYYKLAAKQDDADAQFALGLLYKNGNGVKKNYNKAKKLYAKACDNKLELACDLYNELG
ncbi:tetratricopeptide repeat protein [Orbus wheelerorum]|uniref:tetratricopeptide repeat protein n=1 Tax=Orbus wheelerorum TaxID=3074111 RepID=UPI00370DACA8